MISITIFSWQRHYCMDWWLFFVPYPKNMLMARGRVFWKLYYTMYKERFRPVCLAAVCLGPDSQKDRRACFYLVCSLPQQQQLRCWSSFHTGRVKELAGLTTLSLCFQLQVWWPSLPEFVPCCCYYIAVLLLFINLTEWWYAYCNDDYTEGSYFIHDWWRVYNASFP